MSMLTFLITDPTIDKNRLMKVRKIESTSIIFFPLFISHTYFLSLSVKLFFPPYFPLSLSLSLSPFLSLSSFLFFAHSLSLSLCLSPSLCLTLSLSLFLSLFISQICMVHDLAESLVGDITPYDGVSKADKRKMEEVSLY